MEKSKLNELLKEWRHRTSFLRGEILVDLRNAQRPSRKIKIEGAEQNEFAKEEEGEKLKELETLLREAEGRQKENEERIGELEKILNSQGIDPWKATVGSFFFVDTESSNCYDDIYKMCEYGHFATDASFNEIPNGRKDLLIRPGRDGKFNLLGRKDGRNLTLAHSYNEYRRAPLFPDRHNDIKFFLEQESAMVLMWAGENDIQALLDQCLRYEMTKFSFVSYDVQRIFMNEFKEFEKVPSLEKAAAYLDINIEGIVQHRPDEDSFITMLILKTIVERTGKSVKELVDDCPACQCESVKAYASLKKRHKENAERKAAIKKAKAKANSLNEELNELFSSPTPEGTPKEKLFAVSCQMKMHIEETLPLIKQWIGRGLCLRRCLNVAYLVAYDEEERESLKSILNTEELKIVIIDEYEKMPFQA